MSQERFVWFRPLGQFGEEAVDLYRCRRFVISHYDPNSYRDYTLIYYQTSDKRWVECRGDEEYDESLGEMRTIYVENYCECSAITVAHELLSHKTFGTELPEDLKSHRIYGDFEKYAEWLSQTGEGEGRRAIEESRHHPRWEGRTVFFGTKVCKEFKRSAPEQTKLLDAFESKGWVKHVINPFSCSEKLKNTVVSMNRWPGSLILFGQDGRRANWRHKDHRPNSSISP